MAGAVSAYLILLVATAFGACISIDAVRFRVRVLQLLIPHVRINARLQQQRFVSATFDNIAVFQHQYLIRVDNRRQTMGDNDCGAIGAHASQCRLYVPFGLCVQCTRGLVQQNNGRRLQNGPR